MTKKSNSQTEEIRSVYEEKLKTLADSKEQLLEEISNLKNRKQGLSVLFISRRR